MFHTYSGIVRYSTFVDITKLLSAIIVNVLTLLVINYFESLFGGDGMLLRLAIVLYGVFAFLDETFEMLHTQDPAYIVDSIEKYIKSRRKTK